MLSSQSKPQYNTKGTQTLVTSILNIKKQQTPPSTHTTQTSITLPPSPKPQDHPATLLQSHIRGYLSRNSFQDPQNNHQLQQSLQKRLHPRTHADFSTLLKELKLWHELEIAKRPRNVDPVLFRTSLLRKELLILRKVAGLKRVAVERHRVKKREARFIASSSETWRCKGGGGEGGEDEISIVVETPATRRAARLKKLYDGLVLTESEGKKGAVTTTKVATLDERLEALVGVKRVVEECGGDFVLTRDIAALVDREADTLHRGRGRGGSLDGLRVRLKNLFVTFCETEEFHRQESCC